MSTLDYRDRIRDEMPESYNIKDSGILFRFITEMLYCSLYNMESNIFEKFDIATNPDYDDGILNNCDIFIENLWGSMFDVHKHDRESWEHYADRLVQCMNAYNNTKSTKTRLEYIISGTILGVTDVSISTYNSGSMSCSFNVDYLVDNMSQVIDIAVVKAKYQRMVYGLLAKYLPAGILINSVICGTVTKMTEYIT